MLLIVIDFFRRLDLAPLSSGSIYWLDPLRRRRRAHYSRWRGIRSPPPGEYL